MCNIIKILISIENKRNKKKSILNFSPNLSLKYKFNWLYSKITENQMRYFIPVIFFFADLNHKI